ncbi:MAG TPA: RidA family protein [Intrasporangium sp.]|nr:RidA family protein [Intrasporangium sp.]
MRQRLSTGSPWEDLVGYSRAMRVGNTIHVSGTTAVRDGQIVGAGDAYTQTTVALEILTAALAELGATPADVVRTRMFVTDISRWEEYGRAHGEVFRDVRPTASMLEVSALIHPDLLVEIEAEAIVDGRA